MNGNEDAEFETNGNYQLDITNTIELDEPDLTKARQDRLERTKATMKAFDPVVAQDTIPKVDNLSHKERAAILIQCHYRGYLGRKLYTELLYEQFEQAELTRLERTLRQVEEGELLVENHNLEVQLEDNATTRKNKARHYTSDIVTIQRAWRAYKRRQSQTVLEQNMPRHDSDVEEINENESETSKMSTSTTAESFTDVSAKEAWGEDMPLLAPSIELNDDDDNVDNDETDESLPSKPLLSATHLGVNKLPESECESDYSEMADPVQDHFDRSHVQIINKQDLDLCNSMGQLSPSPDETEEEFAKRVRKMNYLSLAQEFAELKKVNADALPFNLHKGQNLSPDSESSSSVPSSEPSAAATPCEVDKPFISKDAIDGKPPVKVAWTENKPKTAARQNNDNLIDFETDCSKDSSENSSSAEMSKAVKDVASKLESVSLDEFDVLNVETTLPKLDWEALEMQLQRAAEEEKNRQTARKNDREEIRRKLAAGFDEEFYAGERMTRKPPMQARLQGGMNLQICFMNEASSDGDSSETEGLSKSPRLGVDGGRPNPFQKESPVVITSQEIIQEENLDMNTPPQATQEMADSTKSRSDTESSGKSEDEDFFARQARLQAEARLALAQARPMARMQLEIEKQQKKKSSVAEQVGIFGDGKRKKLSRAALNVMNLAQTQVLVNDLHTQIENLNDDLVQMLVLRDDLHMEQDSMLVDIEDLTRRAQELAAKVNDQTSKKAEKEKSNKKQKHRRKIFS